MKIIFFSLAWVCLTLGIIGALVPVLPTTPFLILAAFLFSKSSPRFHKWVLNLPLAGQGLRDWQDYRVIRPRAKVLCSAMILASILVLTLNQRILIAVKISMIVLLVSVGTFVISRKSR